MSRLWNCDVRVIPALHERRMGPLSGHNRVEFWHAYEDRGAWMAGDLDATHEGGESYLQMRSRLLPAFTALAVKHQGQTIAVVVHGLVVRVLLTSLVEGLAPEDFMSISIDYVRPHDLRIKQQGRWSLVAGEEDRPSDEPW